MVRMWVFFTFFILLGLGRYHNIISVGAANWGFMIAIFGMVATMVDKVYDTKSATKPPEEKPLSAACCDNGEPVPCVGCQEKSIFR